ncbi:hypothetical protein KFK09_016477 [Dendrobium nobile]|uniref:Kinesin motor domain-containing protein n=1 Tax=Dendrobium nobile TaxID=94219 RepID=A0A8T3B0S3_DENNO|nr:hypothetical protein KFK09_016477 [Dendrobium nobile]
MLRDLKIFRRNSGKNPTNGGNNENLPVDQTVSSASQEEADPSRPPFSTIQEPVRNRNSGLDQETHFRRRNQKTPSKSHTKGPDQFFQLRTPEKLAVGKGRFGWVPKSEQPELTSPESRDYSLNQGPFQLPPPAPLMASHPLNIGNGYCAATPRSFTTGGKASSVHSGTSSTQSTPTKSVSKPMFNGVSNSRATQCGGTVRAMNFLVSSKGIPLSSATPPVYASPEVPHFELKEDPSFWMDHNVQVVIRVRPINSMERSLYGYSRCIKQESSQNISWIGQSETRFMFDYVACETVNQEMLFRVAGLPMVENCMSGYNSCVFAYGQTGSGKTHTMLGEINDLELRPSANRGMTPRIFEFLFARIKAEEESRRDEKLQYSCKCSFLEIYNEQITDLLNPSSTNLLIREDPRKGVHVENLTEFEVENVVDILKLLIQGAANRKVAATNMNRESSRSHSVFTCTIESRWQTDSTSTLRFARLNLVDLAGSERQKTSGAEGERLKESSNINKSLSTLGHVIMVLADLANGRQRHVPYRDSRLTFLLQDSLGGNSKTMIIANVSPSICSANETLSTLKFAQRAKVIQNNAVVNENASGDVFALQHQILLLKEELSMLKQQNVSRSLSFRTKTLENVEHDAYSPQKLHDNEEMQSVRVSNKQLKLIESTLAGSFRREKMAEVALRHLEAEIEQLNRLVREREEDTQCLKMMNKFREDKIYRMEALMNGLIPSESYLLEENNALSEEIKLLRTKVDINPEVTRFAVENIRLLEQLRKFQDFYEEGERGLLLTEISELRNQLAQMLDGKFQQEQHSKSDFNVQCSSSVEEEESLRLELKRVSLELDDCRSSLKSCLEINSKLTREVNSYKMLLKNIDDSTLNPNNFEPQEMDLCLAIPAEVPCSCDRKHAEQVVYLDLEIDLLKTMIAEEKSSRIEAEERAVLAETELGIANEKLLAISKGDDATIDKLKEARSVIEALESQQILSINELEELRENNNQQTDALKKQEQQISTMRNQLSLRIDEKLKRVQASLEKAWNLNKRYQSDQASHTSNEREMDEVRRQVEAETAEVIVCLQEELAALNQLVDDCNKNELLANQRLMDLENDRKEQDDKIYCLTLENTRLAKFAEEKEQNARSIMGHCEELAFEISDLLENGNAQLDYATYEAASISDICSHKSWICEQFGKIFRGISKRDSLIEELQKNLQDACNVKHDMESKLRSLRGATLAITEAQQQENCDKESRILHLTSLLAEKTSIISELEKKVEETEKKVRKVEICAAIFFSTINKLYEKNKVHLQALDEANLKLIESEKLILQKDAIIQEGKGYQDLRAQLGQNYQQDNSVEVQHDMYLDTNWKNEEENIITPGTSCVLVEAKMKLEEFHMRMSTLKSCMHEYAEKENNPTEAHSLGKYSLDDAGFNYENQINIESIQDTNISVQKNAERIQYMIENHGSKNILEREKTIEILRKEIESALQSLKDVQSQMVEMFDEKEEIKKSMLLSHDSIKGLTAEVHQLNSEILNKEKEFEFELLQLEEKLRTVEGNAMAFNCIWRKEKEDLELEISEVKAVSAHKRDEISNLLIKIEEGQETMREADVVVNTLMEANRIANLEIDRLKKTEISLCHENCNLASKLHKLQASLDEKDENLERIQMNFKSNIMEAVDLVLAVEDHFMSLKDAFVKNFTLINHDLDGLKCWMLQHIESRMCLEEIWLGFIGIDCAASVLHLCHVGVLLERITGLNGEICFLQNGLLESNSLVTNLREQNIKSNKEVQMCSVLKGKLLLDINNSFTRITKKENETLEFSAKLNSFEKKIVDLQFMEETMLEKSNDIGHELDALRDELIAANKEIALRAAVQEKLIKENEEANGRLEELSLLLKEVQVTNKTLRDELDMESNEKFKVTERLVMELFNMNISLDQQKHLLEDLQEEMYCIKYEKDNLESHVSTLNEKLNLVEENEAIAAEQLEKLFMENEQLKLRLMEMSIALNELHGKYVVICKDSDHVKTIAVERLQKVLLDVSILLGERDHLIEELQKDISRIAHEKDEFESEACTLKEKMKLANPIAEKNETLVTEAPQRNLLMENEQLKLHVEHTSRSLHEVQAINRNLHEQLEDKMISSEILQKELLDLNTLLSKKCHILQEFQNEINVITHSKEQLESQVSILKELLEMAESVAEVNEAVAREARQIAEERKTYAQAKEEEVKLLERSVEELECTVNALQEQVKIVKEEAERQILQRSELDMEEEAVRSSDNVWNLTETGHFDLSRHLKEKLTELEDAQHIIQLLQKKVADKDLEIVHCKSIISELNLHAEAQSSEYKRKFKELEAMAFHVKSELVNPNTASLTSTKPEKGSGKSRGSGSPFKCIGLGLAQQINNEKDEELIVARSKIEELEALAANRQKQIFMLNIRLAAAESMTHDVLRDLLGIKLDMSKYAKMNERSPSDNVVKEKDEEWGKLKKQVDEFVEERQRLLEEINQRHRELMATQISLEKLEEHDKLLSTENKLLKVDNAKYKNIIMELEDELEKSL